MEVMARGEQHGKLKGRCKRRGEWEREPCSNSDYSIACWLEGQWSGSQAVYTPTVFGNTEFALQLYATPHRQTTHLSRPERARAERVDCSSSLRAVAAFRNAESVNFAESIYVGQRLLHQQTSSSIHYRTSMFSLANLRIHEVL